MGEMEELAAEIAKDWNGRELDTAWAVAEHALPEGWLLERVWLNGGQRGPWEARAGQGPYPASVNTRNVGGYGPTPAAALQSLAEKLRALREADPS